MKGEGLTKGGGQQHHKQSDDKVLGHVEQRYKVTNIDIDRDDEVIKADIVSLHIESDSSFY